MGGRFLQNLDGGAQEVLEAISDPTRRQVLEGVGALLPDLFRVDRRKGEQR